MLIFVVNEPATTGISTCGRPLSRHDALPIGTWLGFVQVGGARFNMLARAYQSCVRGGQRLSHPDEGDGDAVDRGGDGAVDRRVAAGAVERFAGERRQDRKSTRLNSSH